MGSVSGCRDVCGCNKRVKEAGLGRGRIWTVMIHSGLGQSHREIWNWAGPSKLSHNEAFVPSHYYLEAACYWGAW